MSKDLEFRINKGEVENFLVDLGQLMARYELGGGENKDFLACKSIVLDKYGLKPSEFKRNYIIYRRKFII